MKILLIVPAYNEAACVPKFVETLADAFGLPKSAVEFKSGETSKTKRILLRGINAKQVQGVVEVKSKGEK